MGWPRIQSKIQYWNAVHEWGGPNSTHSTRGAMEWNYCQNCLPIMKVLKDGLWSWVHTARGGAYFPKFKGSRVGIITKAAHKLTMWDKNYIYIYIYIFFFLSQQWNRPSILSLIISLFCNTNVLFSGIIVFLLDCVIYTFKWTI